MLRYIPNLLSGLRLALAPATAGLVANGNFLAAFGVFAFAGFTDALDGRLAKRWNCPTKLGSILDPAADKALMIAAFLALAFIGDVPVWLAVVVIFRDVLIGIVVAICLFNGKKLDMEPMLLGKVTTTLQIAYLAIHLAALAFAFSLGPVVPFDACVVGAVTAVSAFAYVPRWMGAMRGRRAA